MDIFERRTHGRRSTAQVSTCAAPRRKTSARSPFLMFGRMSGWLLGSMLCAALASCAHTQQTELTGWFRDFNSCRDEYAAMDARVAAAGVGDAAYYHVPGYPYLRTNRVLASFRNEVEGVNQVGGWIRQMRELDQEAREYEYINLGMTIKEAAIQRFRFLNCGRALASVDLDEPAGYAHLLSVVQPADEYSTLARTIGLYPLAVPLMRSQLSAKREADMRELTLPVDELSASAPLWLWSVKPVEDLGLLSNAYARAVPDELGMPGLVDSEWRALAEYYAPRLWIETADDGDWPAAPQLTPGGPAADPAQPLVNYQINFTRFHGAGLVQISYFVWFKGTKAAGAAGALDGFIWRVTLDTRGQALVYESLHQSGSDHRWFPAQPLALRGASAYWEEPPLVIPGLAPTRFATLRLAAGTHALQHVTAPEQAQGASPRQYELRRYEDLFTLPYPDGGTRSLFDPDGRVKDTYSPDPLGWIGSGLRQPGVLRQYGHHAIAHIGRSHFDDAFLLETVFAPEWRPNTLVVLQ
ncbi:MAG: hypothetical protein JWR07_4938 [Nevskia sp.]|nr:hypothetical protein [Nevskia sp.]